MVGYYKGEQLPEMKQLSIEACCLGCCIGVLWQHMQVCCTSPNGAMTLWQALTMWSCELIASRVQNVTWKYVC